MNLNNRPARPQNNIKRNSQNVIVSNSNNKQNIIETQITNKEEKNSEINSKNNSNETINNSKMIMAVTKDTRLPLNVEDLLIQEDKLYKILDNIRIKVNFNFSAEEYLEFSHITSIQTFVIFFEEKYKENINNAQIYEFISAVFSVFIYLKNFVHEKAVDHLKNILFYTHQNLIMIIVLLLKKIGIEYENNIWVLKLKDLVKLKRAESMNGDEHFVIEQNNRLLFNSIINFIKIYFKNPNDYKIFSIFNEILNNLYRLTLDNVKNNLFNLKNMLIYSSENTSTSFVHVNLPGPFLPPINKKYEYTLVLDLDETIIHCIDQQEITPLIRPGTKEFLSELSNYYEIVIFTASIKEYADTILNLIDNNKMWISHRLYRPHTTVLKSTYLKDISKLGRDLSKTIIIDNACDNFQLQSDNGIFIQTWIDDPDDKTLYNLIPVLKEIVVKKIKDVRKALRKIRDTMIRLYVRGDSTPYSTVLQYITGEKKLKE